MDHQASDLKSGRVSFAHNHLSSFKGNRSLETRSTRQGMHHMNGKKSHCSDHLESTYPSESSDLSRCRQPNILLQMFPLNAHEDLTRLNEAGCKYEHHEDKRRHKLQMHHEGKEKERAYRLDSNNKEQEDQDTDSEGKFQKPNAGHLGKHEFLWFNSIRTWLSTQGYLRSMLRKHVSHPETWFNMHYVKAWLGGASISTLSEEYKEKRKDGLRVQRAQVHAALSVAGVAAAILGFAANSTSGWDPGLVSAASLVAAVCAETAEALGADRACVSSVINSAILACSPNEILTLTASAATCLRGAATLQGRVHSDRGLCTHQCAKRDPDQPINNGKDTHHHTDSMVNEAALSSGADLPIRTHDGKKTQKRNVRVFPSHSVQNRVVMRLTKKCLGGFIVTTKEYDIVTPPTKEEGWGGTLHLLRVDTRGGGITCILFTDEKERDIWGCTIAYMLKKSTMTI
ncbi:unnamed protein product [Victoria cruziana]